MKHIRNLLKARMNMRTDYSEQKLFMTTASRQTVKTVNLTLGGISSFCAELVYVWFGDVRWLLLPPRLLWLKASVRWTEAVKRRLLSRGRQRFSNKPAHSFTTDRIDPVCSCWITSGPFFSPFGRNTGRLTGLCEWKLCGDSASVPLRVRPDGKQAPQQKTPAPSCLVSCEQKEQKKKSPENTTQLSPCSSTCGRQNTTNRWVRGIASRWIYKGIVAVDCTEFQLLL